MFEGYRFQSALRALKISGAPPSHPAPHNYSFAAKSLESITNLHF